jgi:hypothetical protein
MIFWVLASLESVVISGGADAPVAGAIYVFPSRSVVCVSVADELGVVADRGGRNSALVVR